MGILEDNFSDSLMAWKNKHFKGTQKELGAMFGVSQGQINNVLNKIRCGDETWRRMVAKKIGIPYDQMIGLDSEAYSLESKILILADKHADITKNFQNQDIAIEINTDLVEIEKIDPDELEEIRDNIKAKLKKLTKRIARKKRTANGED